MISSYLAKGYVFKSTIRRRRNNFLRYYAIFTHPQNGNDVVKEITKCDYFAADTYKTIQERKVID